MGKFVIKLFPDFENNFIAADSIDIRKFVCRINCHEKEKQKFGMRLESNVQSIQKLYVLCHIVGEILGKY